MRKQNIYQISSAEHLFKSVSTSFLFHYSVCGCIYDTNFVWCLCFQHKHCRSLFDDILQFHIRIIFYIQRLTCATTTTKSTIFVEMKYLVFLFIIIIITCNFTLMHYLRFDLEMKSDGV